MPEHEPSSAEMLIRYVTMPDQLERTLAGRSEEELLCHLPEAWKRHVLLKRFTASEEREITVSQLIHNQTNHALHHLE